MALLPGFTTEGRTDYCMANLIPLGNVTVTEGAHARLEESFIPLPEILDWHQSGEWGLISSEDRKGNFAVLAGVLRGWIHGLYATDAGYVEVITEGNGSATTVLLPSEPL